jgi:hypothetical protein
MSSYKSQIPQSPPLNPAYTSFFESFYAISDTPTAHDKYVDQFTADATVIMASKRCAGRDEILALRKWMWAKVESRKHRPTKIYPFGDGADEVMLYGVVEYVMKEGMRTVNVDWAARAVLVEDGEGVVRMSFYQVYLVSFCSTGASVVGTPNSRLILILGYSGSAIEPRT